MMISCGQAHQIVKDVYEQAKADKDLIDNYSTDYRKGILEGIEMVEIAFEMLSVLR